MLGNAFTSVQQRSHREVHVAAFTKALYYPWQDVHDARWLRTACLYWDEIATIVARGDRSPYNSPETKALHDRGVLVPISVFYDDAWRSAGLMRRLARSKEWKDVLTRGERRRAAYLLETRDEWITGFHWDIMYGAFKKDRLLDWRHLRGNIAHMYLTILAASVSASTGRALITDTPGMRLLAESVRIGYPLPGVIQLQGGGQLPTPNFWEDPEPPQSLQVAVIDVALRAVDVDPGVPIGRLIDFREKYSDELIRFRSEIDRLAREVRDDLRNGEYATAPDAVSQAVHDKLKTVDSAIMSLERRLRDQRISSKREWLEVAMLATVPSAVVAPTLGMKSLPIGATAAAIRIGFGMRKSAIQRNRMIDGDPYSYLLLARREFSSG